MIEIREEQNALIEYLKREGEFQTNYLPIIGILLGTAMRIGEALALTWNDIDCLALDWQHRRQLYSELFCVQFIMCI